MAIIQFKFPNSQSDRHRLYCRLHRFTIAGADPARPMGRQGQAADLDAKRADHWGGEGDTRALGAQACADPLFVIGEKYIGEEGVFVFRTTPFAAPASATSLP